MVLDATALLLLLNEKTSPPCLPGTKDPIPNAHERVVNLVNELTAQGERVIIAAPVFAELMVRAENAASKYVAELATTSRFRMVSFDEKAAIEHAIYTRTAIEEGDKFGGVPESWTKVKFDRQIVAIAKISGAHTICTDDEGLTKHALKQGLKVISISQLKLNAQQVFEEFLKPVENEISIENEPGELADEETVVAQTKTGGAVVETAPPESSKPITLLAESSIDPDAPPSQE